MNSTTPWLSEAEQRAWRSWLSVNAQLPTVLHRQLQRDSGLSLQDFEVLVHLTETTDNRSRVADLAQALQWERSRLSHHIKRMEARGLVLREECLEDGRGAWVVLTEPGLTAIENAAPSHAQTVEERVFDPLSKRELDGFSRAVDKVLFHLNQPVSGTLVPSGTKTSPREEIA
ncbi:MarR family winged helix-turn-helix transcriptional regulator [Tessaracoccus antarcticus]|uniref:MarR family transcriptional regulator n=1 Tax=Tessaracoccus antarcticus TaxID=2479848 RepID=A0A3M0G9V6_9ACTN|nr:MarR family winged helix-turn-helix transcriptional regulator [Tessaracoccus antarcticus]RMB61765.1 MarR family transcriptional regulator [Tessaracoccus antarcticus]